MLRVVHESERSDSWGGAPDTHSPLLSVAFSQQNKQFGSFLCRVFQNPVLGLFFPASFNLCAFFHVSFQYL